MGCWSRQLPVDSSLLVLLGWLDPFAGLERYHRKTPENTRATTTSTTAVMLLISSSPSMKANGTGIDTSTEARA